MPHLILDLMGGDHSPHAMLEGTVQALSELSGRLTLIGDEAKILPILTKRRYRLLQQALQVGQSKKKCKIEFIHSPEVIEMEDSIRVVRSKPEASINIACRMAAESWAVWKSNPDALSDGPAAAISAGHSGAMMASALLNMGRLPNVERPAIAVKLPNLSDDGCIVLDVGANIDCKPEHLRDFAVMGALFAQVDRKNSSLPKVGVLSNGEERIKGTELTRATLEAIEKLECFTEDSKKDSKQIGVFLGYTEGKQIFNGQVDVMVMDGFVGNVVLKGSEGLAMAFVSLLKREARKSPLVSLGFLLAAGAFKRLKRKVDYAETGAAPLLGVAGYAFISHGSSKGRAIKNALLKAQSAVRSGYVEKLEAALAVPLATSPLAASNIASGDK